MRRNLLLSYLATQIKWLPYSYEYIYHNLVPSELPRFNIWDEEWEVGNISGDNGRNVSNNSTRRSINYIKVAPNSTYHFYWVSFLQSSSIGVMFYDIAKNFINAIYFYSANYDFVIPSNAYFIRFRIYNQDWDASTIVAPDICINKSNAQLNGHYAPYSPRKVLDKSRILKISGNSEVRNQLVIDPLLSDSSSWLSSNCSLSFNGNGCEATVTNDGVTRILPTNSIKFLANHIYYVHYRVKVSNSNMQVQISVPLTATEPKTNSTTWTDLYYISSRTTNYTAQLPQVYCGNGIANEKIYAQIVELVDLSQAFPFNTPTSITDPRVQNIIAQGYLPKNDGEIKNSVISEIESRGFNLISNIIVGKYINHSDGTEASASNLSCTDFIKVLPNETYYLKESYSGTEWGACYDENKAFISAFDMTTNSTKTTPSNCAYIRMTLNNSENACINRSSSLNGIYKPFATKNKLSGEIYQNSYNNYGLYFACNKSGTYTFSIPDIAQEIGCDEATTSYHAIKHIRNTNVLTLDLVSGTNYAFYVQINNDWDKALDYKNSAMLNEGSVAQPYLPFGVLDKIQLPAPLELGGVNTAENTFEVTENGYVFTRNVFDYVFTGSESWYGGSSNFYFIESAYWSNKPQNNGFILANVCQIASSTSDIVNTGNGIALGGTGNIIVGVNDQPKFIANSKITYQLATPQTITIPRKHLKFVKLKDCTWTYANGFLKTNSLGNDIVGGATSSDLPNAFCNDYMVASWSSSSDRCIYVAPQNNTTETNRLQIKDARFTNATDFVNSLTDNDVLFYYSATETTDFVNEEVVESGGEVNGQCARVPIEYQEVEYIESTGTQYIDPNLQLPNGFRIKAKVKTSSVTGQSMMFLGSIDANTNRNYFTFALDQNLLLGYGSGSSDYTYFGSWQANTLYDIDISNIYGNRFAKINGVSYPLNASSTSTYSNNSLYLFAFNNNGTTIQNFVGCFYPLQIYNSNDIIVRNFIPVYRKIDSVIGLYDTIEGKFYTNAGTGTFLKGGNVNAPTCEVLPNVDMLLKCK